MKTAKQILSMVLAWKGMTFVDLAKLLGCSSQNLYQRMQTDKLSTAEWNQIAELLDAQVEIRFTMNDGTVI